MGWEARPCGGLLIVYVNLSYQSAPWHMGFDRDVMIGKFPIEGEAHFGFYSARYRLLLSFGRACRYRPVVATLLWPSVACTRWIGAPRSRACEACAWRSQCADTAAGRPARAAAAFTIRCTWEGSSAPPLAERIRAHRAWPPRGAVAASAISRLGAAPLAFQAS